MRTRLVIEQSGRDAFHPFTLSEVDEEGEIIGTLGSYETPDDAKAAYPDERWRPAPAAWQPDTLFCGKWHNDND